ncbi:ABC transporter permease [Agrobacterium sp. Azo12]|jgi:putative hydroxymethylpyrimidine transport system permease protein|uniref:ABC transporter permease n=1 Tax=Agrobacterium sp. Azo12 TaxID=3031129 RepID=UPI0023D82656|nr:ABC transporter permease [Agrobacterium sp. Azo12]MDO5897929.1 ABC transporter permease [Agrobacterium sp. Azo12]
MRVSSAVCGVLLLVVGWQVGTWLFAPAHYILPSPYDVVSALSRQPSYLLENSLITLTEMVVGLVLGTGFGVGTAFATAAFPRVGKLVWPTMLILQAFPVFVLAPILVLWLGFGMASKVAMTTLIIFFPVASAFNDGLQRTERAILDAAALTQATHWQILLRLRVPLALPGLISGLRVAAPLAPLGAVIGEWVGASSGLGFVMVQANARMQTDTVFAAMAILAVLTVLSRLFIDRVTRGLTPWAVETEHSLPFLNSSRKHA